MDAREILRVLRRDRWEVDGSFGSHLQLRHRTKPGKVTVPIHAGDVIGPKLLKSILDQASLTAEDFQRLR